MKHVVREYCFPFIHFFFFSIILMSLLWGNLSGHIFFIFFFVMIQIQKSVHYKKLCCYVFINHCFRQISFRNQVTTTYIVSLQTFYKPFNVYMQDIFFLNIKSFLITTINLFESKWNDPYLSHIWSLLLKYKM